MNRVFNFALCFEAAVQESFIRYSEHVVGSGMADFTLGSGSLPHLTLLQFELDSDDTAYIAQQIRRLAKEPIQLQLMGLTLLPTKDGHLWIEVSVLKSDVLLSLQRAALGVVGDATVHSGVGDAYRPHITVARLLKQEVAPRVSVAYDIVRRSNVIGHAVVGMSGPQYQLVRIL